MGDGGGRGLVVGRGGGRGGHPWDRPSRRPLPIVVIAMVVVVAALIVVAIAATANAAAAAARPGGCGRGAKAVHAADGSVAPCRYDSGGHAGRDAGHGLDVHECVVPVHVVWGLCSETSSGVVACERALRCSNDDDDDEVVARWKDAWPDAAVCPRCACVGGGLWVGVRCGKWWHCKWEGREREEPLASWLPLPRRRKTEENRAELHNDLPLTQVLF